MILDIENLSCGYGGQAVVEGFSARIETGQVFCLLGPNGVGKTTLFRTVLGLQPALAGTVRIDGRDVARMRAAQLAELVAYVPQSHRPPFAFRARDVVVTGAVARRGPFSSPSADDVRDAERVLERLGVGRLADRAYTELSGGERQMVLIARALAQRPRFLMMDEPTSSLDFGNQARVLRCVRRLADDGLGVVMTTHAPQHMAACRARGALLVDGRTFVTGSAAQVLTPEHLRAAYGVEVAVADLSVHGHAVMACEPIVDVGDGDVEPGDRRRRAPGDAG